VNLEPRIRELSRRLLDQAIERGEMDLATEFAVPLPMLVIAELLGVPPGDWPRYKRWSDVILGLANTFSKDEQAMRTVQEYHAVTDEMRDFVTEWIESRNAARPDDLLSRLVQAEVDGERLSHPEILGFVQLLLVAGQETTANLINNAVVCLMESPHQLARLRDEPELMSSTIEEVLRYRSPVQWMPRATTRDVELAGTVIPAHKLVFPIIGSANRDAKQFPEAERFDITRNPNPHLAFGFGIHSCLGAPLARLEARIALTDFLDRTGTFEPASDQPWEPRKALHVHGPTRLPIRFTPAARVASSSR
jgi:cytochrome P450